MCSKLRIISYNCQSFSIKVNIIQELLNDCDILLLQETLLTENNCMNFDQIDNNFVSASIPAVRANDVTSGRASGGLAIFWRKTDDISCFPIFFLIE